MFWFLRRTGAVNFLNAFNNSNTSKVADKSKNNLSDKNKSWLRIRYGRLSVDSDDHNFNKKCDVDGDDDDALVEYKVDTKCCDKINDFAGSQYYDANGNAVNGGNHDNEIGECDCEGVVVDSQIKDTTIDANDARQKGESTMNKLMSMALSDYDESLTCNVCDRAFHCHRQLASHQQKKRHFGCSACDTIYPSLMLLEHHKDEFEHYSDDEDAGDDLYHGCCRRNRRDDFDFSDSEAFSDAESEDLERLL